ncbi:MAG: SCO family protein [Pseudomonadota bacterium]
MLRSLAAGLLLASSMASAETPFPIAIGGPYELVDQYGRERTQVDHEGRAQLVFFGYARCPSICTTALPLMADMTDTLEAEGLAVQPVLITVAPEQDTAEVMQEELSHLHDDFLGLSGDEAALQTAYDGFAIAFEPIFEDPEYGWIYAHSSFIHLLDADGTVLAVIPPILGQDRALEIARKHLAG